MTDLQLSASEKSELRSALLKAGIKTRGLSNSDLLATYEKHVEKKVPETAPETDKTEATTTTTKEPKTVPAQPQNQQTELANRIAALISGATQNQPQIDEARIVELIREHATKTVEVSRADTDEKVKIEGAHYAFEEVIEWLQCDENVYLVGPAGSGKTTLARQCAEALGRPFYSTGAILAAYELLGFRDAHGVYHESALYNAFKHGGLFLFDEVDGSSAKALIAFNQLLENGWYTFPNGEVVEQHPDFVCIAGANTVGSGATRQYIGRNPLDGASLERFVMVEITYDPKVERAMGEAAFKEQGGKDMAALDRWIELVTRARAAVAEIGCNVIISPRATRRGAKTLARGVLSEKRILEATILNRMSPDQQTQLKSALGV